MTGSTFLVGFFIFVGSVALGALGYERWLSHVVANRKKVARNHALRAKPLTSRDELQVWRWLEEVFPEHRILPKIPFTGFIEPNQRGGDAHWQALLSTVNFSCALADQKGTVLGCIDVLGRGEITDRKHAFKRELLGRAGIPYWIIESQRRPSAALLREKFLGAATSEAVKARDRRTRPPPRSRQARAAATVARVQQCLGPHQNRHDAAAPEVHPQAAVAGPRLRPAPGRRRAAARPHPLPSTKPSSSIV
jgi:hypothetical protein